MRITLHYIDGCPGWAATADLLETIARERPDIAVTHQRVTDPDHAAALGFRGSPSILADGADLFPDGAGPVAFACRRYATPTGFAVAPTLDQLREAVDAAASLGASGGSDGPPAGSPRAAADEGSDPRSG